ncbi:hypothetical protein [Streptomyces sp. NPDC017435]|uniref:hypothetical protein n=1 Tax=Streptomyces sp. NPDC017435 TaxID=3364995 RepID=UPI00378B0C58
MSPADLGVINVANALPQVAGARPCRADRDVPGAAWRYLVVALMAVTGRCW